MNVLDLGVHCLCVDKKCCRGSDLGKPKRANKETGRSSI